MGLQVCPDLDLADGQQRRLHRLSGLPPTKRDLQASDALRSPAVGQENSV
jgi:hypothetical protein